VQRIKSSNLNRGLVGAWCPSIAGSGLLLPDLSGYGNHGTLTNMDASDWVGTDKGRALDFDGSDDYVSIAGAAVYAQNARPFSVSCFAYIRNFNNPYSKLVMLKSDDASAWEFGLSDQPSYRGVLIGTNGQWARIRADIISNEMTNGWHHYLVTYNGLGQSTANNFQFYFDANLKPSTNADNFSATNNVSSICLDASNNRLTGQLTDIRIYNRALTPSEIKQLYEGGPGFGLRQERKRSRFQVQGFNAGRYRRQQLIGTGVY
jgi:hypothetical protein